MSQEWARIHERHASTIRLLEQLSTWEAGFLKCRDPVSEIARYGCDMVESVFTLRKELGEAGRMIVVLLNQLDLHGAGLCEGTGHVDLHRLPSIEHSGLRQMTNDNPWPVSRPLVQFP